jgi:hypothetical protein
MKTSKYCFHDLIGLVMTLCISILITPAFAQNIQAEDLLPPTSSAAGPIVKTPVGTIKVVTGLVNLQTAEGKNKFASVGTKLNVGDIINTQSKSTAVLEFIDTTQVALRPDSRFVVQNYEYQPEQPIADKAEFKLVKGGLRTLTGLIGKRGSSEAFALKSETATIGIRGTDFTARICSGSECKRLASGESEKATVTNTSNADVAGRVSQVTGELFAFSAEGRRRILLKSAALFSGESVEVAEGGFAVLTMADSTRLTLPGGSSMQVAAYRYAPASPQTSVASFKLLKGAVRAVTGAIAKAEPKNVKFFTETATVGIRGTALDISCTSVSGGLVQCSGSSNFTVELRDGQLIVSSGGSNSLISAGQSAIIPAGKATLQVINSLPNVLGSVPNAGPLPENTPSNFESLSITSVQSLQQGIAEEGSQLFVSVNEGTIVITNSNQIPLEVNRGEGAFVQIQTDLPPQLLTAPPDIIVRDSTLSAPPFSAPQCGP